MSEPLSPLLDVPFVGPVESRRLQKNYARRRKAYRRKYPDRTPDPATALYVAPEEIQPLLKRAIADAEFLGPIESNIASPGPSQ